MNSSFQQISDAAHIKPVVRDKRRPGSCPTNRLSNSYLSAAEMPQLSAAMHGLDVDA